MIISRYISREMMNALLAVTAILLVAFLCQQVVRYLNYVAIGKIPTGILLELVSFEIPYLLALLLPLGLYVGILLSLGRLYSDNEMAILQLSGYGHQRVTQLTGIIAIFISAIVLFLMLWVNPLVSAKRQQVMASDEATVHLIQTVLPGRFQVSADGSHVMYVEKLSRDRQRAENVFLAQKKNQPDAQQNTWMLVFANEGYQMKDPQSQEQLFVTTDGYRYEGAPGQNDYKIIQYKKYAVRIPQNDMHITHQEVEILSTSQLWQNYTNPKYAAELQWRFSIALSAFLLALLAVPLSSVAPRESRYIMLVPAVLIYIVYIHLLFIARHWVEQSIIPINVGMWWAHGLVLLIILMIIYIRSRKLR
ncbi:MAG: LPS export ABC transporter permease LptF [Gammaproteobacteria bacterium]|nr:LPS export ABC transporter permease LptF [Gammaproteobacteria bacterium]